MKYKLFHNSEDGTHCVQACIQMILYASGRNVLSLTELDTATIHDANKWTWFTDAALWLRKHGFKVTHVENFDYKMFAEQGVKYLKTVWDETTFENQNHFSDLYYEQKRAKELIKSDINLVNGKLSVHEIRAMRQTGFVLLSVNPYILDGIKGEYGSHMVFIQEFDGDEVVILDPDKKAPSRIATSLLAESISDRNKSNFEAVLLVDESA